MKIYIFLIIAALAVVGFTIWDVSFLSASSQDVIRELEFTNQALQEEDWEAAHDSFQLAHDKWEKYNHIWPMLIEHNEITDIEISFAKLNVLMDQKELNQAVLECTNLKYLLNHVARNEKINLQNIF